MIDAAWQGNVQFHEVIFGTWTSYAFLVWMWESGFEKNLPEWKYVLITFLGASVYLINHYFQLASFWLWLLNGYSVVFIVVYYKVAVQPMSRQKLPNYGNRVRRSHPFSLQSCLFHWNKSLVELYQRDTVIFG
jgi:hypothetical protein